MARTSKPVRPSRFVTVLLVVLAIYGVYLFLWVFINFSPGGGLLTSLGLLKKGGTYEGYADGGDFSGGDPVMSPDGGSIVYSSPRTGHGDLYLVNSGGSKTRRLTTDPNCETQPCFSPDGSRIAFVREQEHEYTGHIWIMNPDGTDARQLTTDSKEDCSPCFSSDGSKVIFTRQLEPTHPALYCVDIEGKQLRRLSEEHQSEANASISRRGKIVCCWSSGPPEGIWGMNEDGTGRRFVGKGNLPDISSGGSLITFPWESSYQAIWLMNADGSNRKRIFHSKSQKGQPRFTPDDQHILFLDETGERGLGTICVISLDGSKLERITSTE